MDGIPSPYKRLPKPVNFMCCILMYICRNHKDVISKWRYMNKLRPREPESLSLEEAFELFCQGVSDVGPFWDHVLGYWKARSEFPDKILFLKYEEMIKDPIVHVTTLAEFLGQPYEAEEESKGVVHQIVKLCSFENLSSLEVNKTSRPKQQLPQHVFFFQYDDIFYTKERKEFGYPNMVLIKDEVDNWKNYFTDEKGNRLDQITSDKLNGSRLTFGTA